MQEGGQTAAAGGVAVAASIDDRLRTEEQREAVGSKLTRVLVFLIGITVASAMFVISAAMNFRFGLTLGTTSLDNYLYAFASLAADGFKALLPFVAIGLWYGRMRLMAIGAMSVWLLCVAWSMASAIGFASSTRDETSALREATTDRRRALSQRASRLEQNISLLPAHRPAEVVESQITNADIPRNIWRRTNECQDVTRQDSLAACKPVLDLRQELAIARQAAELERQLRQTRTELGSIKVIGKRADPQAETIASLIGWVLPRGYKIDAGAGDVRNVLAVLITLLIEAGSSLGFTVVALGARGMPRRFVTRPNRARQRAERRLRRHIEALQFKIREAELKSELEALKFTARERQAALKAPGTPLLDLTRMTAQPALTAQAHAPAQTQSGVPVEAGPNGADVGLSSAQAQTRDVVPAGATQPHEMAPPSDLADASRVSGNPADGDADPAVLTAQPRNVAADEAVATAGEDAAVTSQDAASPPTAADDAAKPALAGQSQSTFSVLRSVARRFTRATADPQSEDQKPVEPGSELVNGHASAHDKHSGERGKAPNPVQAAATDAKSGANVDGSDDRDAVSPMNEAEPSSGTDASPADADAPAPGSQADVAVGNPAKSVAAWTAALTDSRSVKETAPPPANSNDAPDQTVPAGAEHESAPKQDAAQAEKQSQDADKDQAQAPATPPVALPSGEPASGDAAIKSERKDTAAQTAAFVQSQTTADVAKQAGVSVSETDAQALATADAQAAASAAPAPVTDASAKAEQKLAVRPGKSTALRINPKGLMQNRSRGVRGLSNTLAATRAGTKTGSDAS